MKTIYTISIAAAMLFLLSFQLKSQNELVVEPLPVIQSDRKTTNQKANFVQTAIQPETSYFNATNRSESNNKKQSSLRSSSSVTNSAVGEIVMTSGMVNGALTMNVPIEVNPGVGGMQPSIALVYNNLSGNGIAGAGWNISGLFPITYRNKSIYYDNLTAPAAAGFSSDLCWEGKRLIFLSQSNVTYTLESSEQTVTARKNGSTNELIVSDQQGTSYYYTYDTVNKVFYLTKIADRHGNYMSYAYKIDNKTYYIEHISYGGNSTQSTAHTQFIDFTYETRNDPILNFQFGIEKKTTLRLETISTGSRVYTLDYLNDHFSLLKNIYCQAINGTKSQDLEPLYFGYPGTIDEGSIYGTGNLIKEEGLLTTWFPNVYDTIQATTGRFSQNDTEEGVIFYPKKDAYKWTTLNGIIGLHSQYAPNDPIIVVPTYDQMADTLHANEGFRGLVTLNVDSIPGNQELVLINALSNMSNNQYLSFRVFASTLSGVAPIKTVNYTLNAGFKYGNNYSVTPISYQTGNFTGDGKERVLGIQSKIEKPHPSCTGTSNSSLYLFDLQSGTYCYGSFSFVIEAADQVIAMDYDGDGKTDLFHFNHTGFKVYSLTFSTPTSPSSTFTLTEIASSTAITRDNFDQKSGSDKRKVLFGDINGDGKTDILKTPYCNSSGQPSSTAWVQVLSAGGGTFQTTTYSLPNVLLNTHYDVFMHDFNGDGMSDVACMVDNGGGLKLQILYSDGMQFNSPPDSYPVSGAFADGKLFTLGINSSNCNRVIGYIRGQTIMKLSIDRNETAGSFINSTLSSHNVASNIEYKRIDKNNGQSYTYQLSAYANASFPYEMYNSYFWVVSTLTKSFLNQEVERYQYYYKDAVIHKQGLGFCGFKKILTYDGRTQQTDTVTYDPFKFGIVNAVANYKQKTENTYSLSFNSNKEPKIRLTSQKMTDFITGNVTTVDSLTYDTYGNLTRSVTKYGSDLTEEMTADYYNYLNGASSNNRIGFPLNTTVTKTKGTRVFTTSTHIQYNNRQLPDSITEKVNGNIVSKKRRQYDAFSNVTQEDYIPYGVASKKQTTHFAYSANGRHLTGSTDEFNHATSYAYSNDLLSSTTDYKGNTVQYEYDALGRLSKQTNPDNTIEETEYKYDTYDYYYIKKSGNNRPIVQQTYNGQHRLVKETTTSATGVMQITHTEYDDRGRVYRVSLPSHSNTPAYWNTYTYDNFDRVTVVNYASGKTDSCYYNQNTVTSVIDSIRTSKTYNAAGQLISETDPAGTIAYNPRPDGQPVNIQVLGNILTSFGYDTYGRQTGITDPSAGIQSYVYDSSGNLQKQTDARNKSITMTYDNYNRMISKTSPEFTTRYRYNADNQLVADSVNANLYKSYTYDALGRLFTEKETVAANKWLQKKYTYSLGNISTVEYSNASGIITKEYYFYTNGYLTEIKLNNQTSIWKLYSENNFGQPTQVIGGPTRNYTYDAFGSPTGRKTGSFQEFTYSFNPATGNLNFRKDVKYNKQENFTYDNLNRLLTYNNDSTTYNTKGNITKKSDIGASFTYGSVYDEKPYALTRVVTPTAAVALNNQSVTYTSFKRPATITENGYKATLSYNGSDERVKMVMEHNNAVEWTRYYMSGCYEVDEKASGNKEKLYLGGDFYSAPAVYVKEGTGNWNIYYICRDYLGSITHVISTGSGTAVQQELSYDAWGRLRNPSTQMAYSPGSEPELFLGRGYTGHEHLTKFGLINMNARLYDPALGRFLSPDPYVQAPDFSQSFNRYSYGLNNPLKYTDESGEFWNFIIGGLIGGVVNWATHGARFDAKGLGYFGVGALAGALGAGIGAGISSAMATGGSFSAGFLGTAAAKTAATSFISGAAIGGGSGASSGFVTGFGNGLVEGQNFGQALGQGGIYGLMGGASGAAIGGLVGGISAVRDGRQFWDGSTVTKEYAANVNVTPVQQRGSNNCLPASGESVNKSLGGNMTQEQLRTLSGGDPNLNPLGDGEFWNTYSDATGHTTQGFNNTGAKHIVPTLNGGGRVAVTIPGSGGINHSVVVQNVYLQTVTKVSGTTTQTVMYRVMDPGTGTFKNIPFSKILSVFTIKL